MNSHEATWASSIATLPTFILVPNEPGNTLTESTKGCEIREKAKLEHRNAHQSRHISPLPAYHSQAQDGEAAFERETGGTPPNSRFH